MAEGSGALTTGVPIRSTSMGAASRPGWAAKFGVQKIGSGVILLRTAYPAVSAELLFCLYSHATICPSADSHCSFRWSQLQEMVLSCHGKMLQ